MYKKIFKKRGFTLIELLAVIAIIGTLLAIVSPSLLENKAKARDAKKISELKDLEQAVELYFQENGAFPNQLSNLVPYYEDQSVLSDSDFKYTKTSGSYCIGVKTEVVSNGVSCLLVGSDPEDFTYRIKGP